MATIPVICYTFASHEINLTQYTTFMKTIPRHSTAEHIATIESLSHDGRGVTTQHGKTTFISGALAGEKVAYTLTKQHSRYNEGNTVRVIEASPARATPACAHFS